VLSYHASAHQNASATAPTNPNANNTSIRITPALFIAILLLWFPGRAAKPLPGVGGLWKEVGHDINDWGGQGFEPCMGLLQSGEGFTVNQQPPLLAITSVYPFRHHPKPLRPA